MLTADIYGNMLNAGLHWQDREGRSNLKRMVARGWLTFSRFRFGSLAISTALSFAAIAVGCLPWTSNQKFGAVAAAGDQPTPIKIGFIASLSGVGADASKDMVEGIKLFLKEHNSTIAGHPVQLIIENDQSSPATAMAKALKLIEQDKVDILTGIQLSGSGLAIAPIAEKDKTPLVVAVCGADDLTQRKHFHWLIRTSATASQPTQPFGEWVFKNLGYKRIVTVGVDYPYGWEVVGGFQRGFEAAGGQIVQKIWAPMGFTDFSYLLKQIDQSKADACFICATSASAEILPKQYKDLGIKLPVVAGGTTFDEAYLAHLPDSFIGGYSPMTYCAAIDTPANQHFVSAYKKEYAGRMPSYYAESSYVAGMWIEKAAQQLKGDLSDKAKLLAALKKVELSDAPRGPIKLDEYSNPVENIYVRKLVKSGKGMENALATTFKNVSQFWTWTPSEFLKDPVYSKEFPPCTHCAK
jgi:branched-chain amino acid transport system substrate-binding protein